MVLFQTLLLLLSLSSARANVWTVNCEVLVTQRLDPVVFPGHSPAGHVHTVVGGSRFNKDSSYDDMITSQCTTCNVDVDKSNYWVPQLYVRKKDGRYHYIKNYFAIYYKLLNDRGQTDAVNNKFNKGDILSFPPGFQMKAGHPEQAAALDFVNHKCLDFKGNPNTPGFPPHPEQCTGGIRSEVTMPSCWDGRLHSSNASDPHVVHPIGGWAAGRCPPSHNKRLPTLFFEAIFATHEIFDAGDQLVYSYNDTIGYGFHGDFINGWEKGAVDGFIEYCRTNRDGFGNQCGVQPMKHPPKRCDWEYSETYDQEVFRQPMEELPPSSGPYAHY